jgi:hypothetical protein
VAVVAVQKIHLLEMAALVVVRHQLAVEQPLVLGFLVREIMAEQVLAMLPMMPLLAVAVVLAQWVEMPPLKLVEMVVLAQ